MNSDEIDEDFDPGLPDDVAGREDRGLGLSGWAWRGATMGFRGVCYVVGPFAAVVLIFGLALGAFGLGSGRGWGLHPSVPGMEVGFLAFAALGALFGAAIGLIFGLGRQARPGTRTAAWWVILDRPIRLPWPRRARARPAEDAYSGSGQPLWPWLVGVPAMVVLVFALGFGAYLGRTVDDRLSAAIADADRDDPSWRLDDLMAAREPVPDEENSAFVAAEVVALLPERWPASAPSPAPGAPNPPETPLMAAIEEVSKTPDNVRLDDVTADTLRAELEAQADAVRVALALEAYRRGRHEVELGPTLIDTPLDETQSARTPARLLAADAAIRAQDGALDGALDSCRALLADGRSIGDEPFLISQLVRVAIGGVAMNTTRRVLAQGEPSDAALARLQALILDELAQPLLLRGLRGERATMDEMIRRIGAGEIPISAISGGGPPFDPDGPRTPISPWAKLMFDNQRAVALEWLNEAVAIARRPAHEWRVGFDALEAEVLRVRRLWYGPYTATLPLLLTPAVSAAATAHYRYRADLGSTALLLAAERHRLRTGDWPDSVGAIERDILPSPPLDPFTGEPYRLDRRDGRLLIHSVGPDREDDHGDYDVRTYLKGGPDDIGAVAWDVPLRGRPAPPEGE
jgi:hypothetical protein